MSYNLACHNFMKRIQKCFLVILSVSRFFGVRICVFSWLCGFFFLCINETMKVDSLNDQLLSHI